MIHSNALASFSIWWSILETTIWFGISLPLFSLSPFIVPLGECKADGPCQQLCFDLHDGTFECACKQFYTLADNGYSCIGEYSYTSSCHITSSFSPLINDDVHSLKSKVVSRLESRQFFFFTKEKMSIVQNKVACVTMYVCSSLGSHLKRISIFWRTDTRFEFHHPISPHSLIISILSCHGILSPTLLRFYPISKCSHQTPVNIYILFHVSPLRNIMMMMFHFKIIPSSLNSQHEYGYHPSPHPLYSGFFSILPSSSPILRITSLLIPPEILFAPLIQFFIRKIWSYLLAHFVFLSMVLFFYFSRSYIVLNFSSFFFFSDAMFDPLFSVASTLVLPIYPSL